MRIPARTAVIVSLLAASLAAPIAAQHRPTTTDSARADTTRPAPPPAAPVLFDGDTLFLIRTPIGAFTPAERADAISRRLTRFVGEPRALSADSFNVVSDSTGAEVRLGTEPIMVVTPADAAVEGRPADSLAADYRTRIAGAVGRKMEASGLRALIIDAVLALLVTVVLVVLLRLLGRGFRALHRWLAAARNTTIHGLRIQRVELLSADQLAGTLVGAAQVLRWVLIILLFYIYVPLVFSFFPWTRGYATTLVSYVATPLRHVGAGFVGYLPDLFSMIVLVVVIRFLLKLLRLFFVGVERGGIVLPGFYPEWATPTYKIARFLVLVFGAVLIWPYLPGSSSDAFKGVSVFVGLLLSFGSSAVVANVVSGVVMTYMRPFQLGDRVQIADTTGDVIERTLLVTRIRTIKNVDVTIANAQVLANHIINYSAMGNTGELILHTEVTIGYDAPWRQVHQLLIQAALATGGILKRPEPYVLQTALDDFFVRYELNAYTREPNRMARIYSELHQNIQDSFNAAGVEIMSPHYRSFRDGNAPAMPPAAEPAADDSGR